MHQSQITDFLEFLRAMNIAGIHQIPPGDAAIETIRASGLFAGLADRDAYLAWRDEWKRQIHALAMHQSDMKRARRGAGMIPKETAQMRAVIGARHVSAAIALRHLGKRWSASQAAARHAAAA